MEFFSVEKTTAMARQAAADGCVLLENQNETLPLRQGDRVALFGRIAFDYYKSGLGSGGLVNTRYVVGIADALKAERSLTLDGQLLETYDAWRRENPYDRGQGWGQVPWSQKEMPVTEELVSSAAARNDAAVVVIGRTAGEDQDIRAESGSYLLTDTEQDLIEKVCRHFKRAVVVLNVGSIIDMSWVQECHVPAVLYVWQGGQEGGNGVCDVLTGRVSPSGRLADTIARSVEDYPSSADFGSPVRNFYREDIYVGYRYFETFAKDRVCYPFGFGLSYTDFEIASRLEPGEDALTVTAAVRNTGSRPGKSSVLVYVQPPQGALGKPERVLAGFGKTRCLATGEEQELVLTIPKYRFASFDDSGRSGCANAYVLEAGTYHVYVGGDVRSAPECGSFRQEYRVLQQLEEVCAPTLAFDRLRPEAGEEGLRRAYEAAPLRTVSPQQRRLQRLPRELPFTGDRGWKLSDVCTGKVSMDAFVGQLTREELICLFRGEGMCSPKVTAGTASAFGGLTEGLRAYGIPVGCCADGPSGIRMDCGARAFSLPNGTLLACTFDTALSEQLFTQTGLELRKNRIDTLLGPGMNIHRSPLNGRNFEYFSEDPLLTGLMGAAQLRGLNRSGATGTVKHFCGNNQEYKRHEADGVVSQRALREIYLKGFEYAVREGNCRSVMTTYGPINGIWTAGSYDLNTTVLRSEWGFRGIVMTDWWAKGNWEGQTGTVSTRAPMVAAQNDLYMVTRNASDMAQDDVLQALDEGKITLGELQRGAKNILSFLMRSVAMEYAMGSITQEELEANRPEPDDISAAELTHYRSDGQGTVTVDPTGWNTARGCSRVFAVTVDSWGEYEAELTLSAELGQLAQLPVTVYLDNVLAGTLSIQGTEGRTVTERVQLGRLVGDHHYIKFYFGADGLKLHSVRLILTKPMEVFR